MKIKVNKDDRLEVQTLNSTYYIGPEIKRKRKVQKKRTGNEKEQKPFLCKVKILGIKKPMFFYREDDYHLGTSDVHSIKICK
jgi:hypothetical protein